MGSTNGNSSQPASMFIDYALTWVDQQLEDPQNFPTHSEVAMKGDFEKAIAKPIFTLLYVIICHIYHQHFETVDNLGQVPHLNALFTHFTAYTCEFNLLAPQDLIPMEPLSKALSKGDRQEMAGSMIIK
jgi:hypothetical protein